MPPNKNRNKRRRPTSTTDKSAAAEKTTVNEPSRLKRSRCKGDGNTVSAQQPTASEQPTIDLQRLKNLSATVTMWIETPSNLKPEDLRSILQNVTSLTRTTPVPVILEQVPKLPHFLSSVIKSPLMIDVSLVVACFLHIVLQIISENLSYDNSHSKIPFAEQQEPSPLAKRAFEWGLQILTELIRRPSSHSVHNHVFVEPLHKLHNAMVLRQDANLVHVIQSITRLDSNSLPSAISRICNVLTSAMSNPSCHTIFSSVITETAKLPVTLNSSEAHAQLPEHFISSVFTNHYENQRDKQPIVFRGLSLDAQAELLFMSEEGYKKYVADLRQKITWTADITFVEKETQALTEAAVKHVEIHWRLMDNIRREISADSHSKNGSVFGIHLWKDRVWMREVLSATERRLGREIIWRVHPGIRQCIRQLLILDEAFQSYGNIRAGVIGARTLYEGMKLDQRKGVSRNCHATLIIIESVVERLIWACGRSQRPKQEYNVLNMKETAKLCAAIICAVQAVRWRGLPSENAISETEKVQTLLHEVWSGNITKAHKIQGDQMTVSSTLVIAVIATKGVEAAKKLFAKATDNEEIEHEIRWAVRVSNYLEIVTHNK